MFSEPVLPLQHLHSCVEAKHRAKNGNNLSTTQRVKRFPRGYGIVTGAATYTVYKFDEKVNKHIPNYNSSSMFSLCRSYRSFSKKNCRSYRSFSKNLCRSYRCLSKSLCGSYRCFSKSLCRSYSCLSKSLCGSYSCLSKKIFVDRTAVFRKVFVDRTAVCRKKSL